MSEAVLPTQCKMFVKACDVSESAANVLIDFFVVKGSKIGGISWRLYFLPTLSLILILVKDLMLGFRLESIPFYIIFTISFFTGIFWVGSRSYDLLRRGECGERNSVCLSRLILDEIIECGNSCKELPMGKTFIFSLLFVSVLFANWFATKPSTDVRWGEIMSLISRGSPLGFTSLALDLSSMLTLALFWVVVTASFIYVFGAFAWVLRIISERINSLLFSEGSDDLRIVHKIDSIIRAGSSEDAIRRFILWRKRVTKLTQRVSSIVKSLMVLSTASIAASALYDYITIGRVTHLTFSATLIGVGLTLLVVVGIIFVTKWVGAVGTFMNIAFTSLKAEYTIHGRQKLIRALEEIATISESMGNPLLPSKETWELMAALASLISAVGASIASYLLGVT